MNQKSTKNLLVRPRLRFLRDRPIRKKLLAQLSQEIFKLASHPSEKDAACQTQQQSVGLCKLIGPLPRSAARGGGGGRGG